KKKKKKKKPKQKIQHVYDKKNPGLKKNNGTEASKFSLTQREKSTGLESYDVKIK
ncbi:GnsA/GnsB family addiction module toxin, partial [Escherichia coli]|uniref:GnsA/GnsB family addiction module toxin n=1 Tax=Escherichia coli TaxID=562 RepID=UPI0010CBA217